MEAEEAMPVALSPSDLEPIVIGIDVGLTCTELHEECFRGFNARRMQLRGSQWSDVTGVAFSTTSHASPITLKVIQKWDGSAEMQNKIPTAVCYSAGTKGMKSYGFKCPPTDELGIGMGIKDRFKLFLDPLVLEEVFRHQPGSKIGTTEDVEMWFVDFLTALHSYIVDYVKKALDLAEWSFTTVHYVFSVPAIWDGTTVVKTFEQVIKRAGFEAQDHFIEIALTEAEAAAIYTAQNSRHQRHVNSRDLDNSTDPRSGSEAPTIETGNILLVCDSGGGTTDVSIVKVESLNDIDEEFDPVPKLKQFDFVDGPRAANIAVGSVQIDEDFLAEVEKRLALIPRVNGVPHIPKYAAKKMLERFEKIKSIFGTAESRRLKEFTFFVPGLSQDTNDDRAEVRIKRGRMHFTWDEIAAMFNFQVERIFEGIDHYLQQLEYRMPPEHVTHFVLSGGLGSSQYVQDRIWKRYGPRGHNGPQGYGMQILVSVDPQLAVCKGLVIDKVYRLKHADSILTTRRCRASYGILFNEVYNRQKHSLHGIRPIRNPINDEKYAVHQIQWIIKQGEAITRDKPVCKTFSRLIPRHKISDINLIPLPIRPDARTTWTDIIAMSRTEQLSRLPTHIQEGDARPIAEIVSSVDFGRVVLLFQQSATQVERITRRTGFLRTKEYYKIEVEVRVYIGLADLRFEIWFANEQIAEPEIVKVAWMYPPNATQLSQTLRQLSLSSADANRNSEDVDPDWPLGLISE